MIKATFQNLIVNPGKPSDDCSLINGVVLSVGPEVWQGFQEGMVVYFSHEDAYIILWGGTPLLVIADRDIVAYDERT